MQWVGQCALNAFWQAYLVDYRMFPLVSPTIFLETAFPRFAQDYKHASSGMYGNGSGWFSVGNVGANAALSHPQNTNTAWIFHETT